MKTIISLVSHHLMILQTVRVWQGSENGSYDCRHTLKDHNAEVLTFLFSDVVIILSLTADLELRFVSFF